MFGPWGPRRPFACCCCCSGLGVAPPCSEFMELLTLEPGVDVCTAPFSLTRPLLLFRETCDPGAAVSFADWALSAFLFLLLNRENAIVPVAGARRTASICIYRQSGSLWVVAVALRFRGWCLQWVSKRSCECWLSVCRGRGTGDLSPAARISGIEMAGIEGAAMMRG